MTFTVLPAPVRVHSAPSLRPVSPPPTRALSTPITQKVDDILKHGLGDRRSALGALTTLSNAPRTNLTEMQAHRMDIAGALEAVDRSTRNVMTKTVLREALNGFRQLADQSVNTYRGEAPRAPRALRQLPSHGAPAAQAFECTALSKPPIPPRPDAFAAAMPPKAPTMPSIAAPSLLGILKEQESSGSITSITLDSLITTVASTHGLMMRDTEQGPNSIASLESALREARATPNWTTIKKIQSENVRGQISDALKALISSLQDEIRTLEITEHAYPDQMIRDFEAWFEANAAGPHEWEIINGITNFFLTKAPRATKEIN